MRGDVMLVPYLWLSMVVYVFVYVSDVDGFHSETSLSYSTES